MIFRNCISPITKPDAIMLIFGIGSVASTISIAYRTKAAFIRFIMFIGNIKGIRSINSIDNTAVVIF